MEKKSLTLDGNLKLVHNTGKNRDYFAIVADLGYCRKFLCFDSGVIAECLGVMPKQLADLCPLNQEVPISAVVGA